MKAVFTSLILLIAIALSAQTTTVTYAPAAGYDPKADSIQALKKAHKDTVAKYQGVLTLSDTVQHAYNIENILNDFNKKNK